MAEEAQWTCPMCGMQAQSEEEHTTKQLSSVQRDEHMKKKAEMEKKQGDGRGGGHYHPDGT